MFKHTPHSKLFRTPRFLEMSAVSVEITPTGIYYISHKKTEVGLVPDKFGIVPLVPGEVVHCEVVKREPVLRALQAIRRKTGCDFVRFSIPEEKTYIFKLDLPNLKPEEIREVLDFKIEENIPLSSKEAVFDFEILPSKNAGSNLQVVVSVAPLKIVEDTATLFLDAGLTPIFFSPESNNLARALVHPKNQQTLIIANICEENIILSLVISGIVFQTSSVNFGSAIINESLSKYYKTTPTEAARMKKEKLYGDNSESLEVFSHLINTFSAMKDEIFKFVTYCNEREDIENDIEKVILSGQDAMISGLSHYLSANLGLPVEIGNTWLNNFKFDEYVPEINRAESLNYAVVNGLSQL
jgi:Tfp pilus assembly PilM family ATPase